MADRAQKNSNREQRRGRLFEALEAERERARTQANALQQERNALAVYERGKRDDEERRRRDLDFSNFFTFRWMTSSTKSWQI